MSLVIKDADQNHSEILCHTRQDGRHRKSQEVSVAERGDAGSLMRRWRERVTLQPPWLTVWHLLEKQTGFPRNSAISLLGIHPKEPTAGTQTDKKDTWSQPRFPQQLKGGNDPSVRDG